MNAERNLLQLIEQDLMLRTAERDVLLEKKGRDTLDAAQEKANGFVGSVEVAGYELRIADGRRILITAGVGRTELKLLSMRLVTVDLATKQTRVQQYVCEGTEKDLDEALEVLGLILKLTAPEVFVSE